MSGMPSNLPSDEPSPQPSDKPSSRPSSMPSNVSSGSPSDEPSTEPSDAPTGAPVRPTISNVFLQGPFIERGSSEVVVLPDPPTPDLAIPQTDCPHLQSGLLDWHTEETWTTHGLPVPSMGTNVTLPDNTKVVIHSKIVESLVTVTVPSTSELILAQGIQIKASGFEVRGSR